MSGEKEASVGDKRQELASTWRLNDEKGNFNIY